MPRLLAPVAAIVAARTARRMARPGWRAPVPVLCCGNAGVGGAGKTTLVLDLVQRLRSRGVRVHCLTRGYGGRAPGITRVDPREHRADWVGDEPILLAALAPTWVGADRAAAARAAVAAGATAVVMDDGLQNPGLVKDASFLVIDGSVGFGNGRVLPAGPLREPVAAAAARCRAAVLIGADACGAVAALPAGLAVLRARLVPDTRLASVRVFAFAGIARPGKFHDTLRDAGAVIAGYRDFPDHHPYRSSELQAVLDEAARVFATPVTTPKDMARLAATEREQVMEVGVSLAWEDPAALERILAEVVP